MSAFTSFSLQSGTARFEEPELLEMEQRALRALNSDVWVAVQVARDSLAMIGTLRKLLKPAPLTMAPGRRLRGLASARTGLRRSERGSKQKRTKRG